MAATALGCGLMQAPVPAGSAHHWKATGEALQAQALVSAMGLQTLRLTQVPAAHLGIARQELEER